MSLNKRAVSSIALSALKYAKKFEKLNLGQYAGAPWVEITRSTMTSLSSLSSPLPHDLITLDCSVVDHTIETLSNNRQRVRGCITQPLYCDYPVYYCALLTSDGDHHIRVEGIAGFDSEYENNYWEWNINTLDNTVFISDYSRFTSVDCMVFDEYSNDVMYKKNNTLLPATSQDGAFPYYKYPRTDDGPLLPQLVDYVLSPKKYTIIFGL
jgi:hypothetical protein